MLIIGYQFWISNYEGGIMGKVKKAKPKNYLGFYPSGTPEDGQEIEIERDSLKLQ